MKKNKVQEFDFSNAVPNPFADKLKASVNIKIDKDILEYYKEVADEPKAVSYQWLINYALRSSMDKNQPEKISRQLSSRISKAQAQSRGSLA